jgi:ProQ/FINO family
MTAMDDATLTPDAGAPSSPLPALLPLRALEATLAEQTADPACRPRTPHAPVAARGWDVAHAATLRALLTQPPAVLPNQVGDPLLPLRIGVWDALLALLRPGGEPEALARVLRAYTRSTGYFMACAWKDAMRYDLEGRAVEPVSEEHRMGALKAVRSRACQRRAQNVVDTEQGKRGNADCVNRGFYAFRAR